LPVRLVANGGGGVYAPLGPTHTAYEDIALMRMLPNMTVVAPCDANEMRELIHSSLSWPNPMYIRLGKGGDKIVSNFSSNKFEIGRAVKLLAGDEAVFVTTGITAQIALNAAAVLNSMGHSIGVVHFHTVKPLDRDMLFKLMVEMKALVVVEEHFTVGGIGSAILECCSEACPALLWKVKMLGVTHGFPEKYGSQEELLDFFEINVKGLVSNMKKKLGE
jgi:transketolase